MVRTQKQQFISTNSRNNYHLQSNHNSALAINIEDQEEWRPYLEEQGWDWIGSFDQMHFDYHGSDAADIRPLSVRAFQSLWNLNHPEDQIAEDGVWGAGTKARLLQTPVAGFAKTYVSSQAQPSFPSTDTISIKFGTMRQGATGEQVKRLQYALNAHGFEVTVDGNFGASTTEAVKAFQKQVRIGADGVVGTMTLEALGLLKHS